MRDNPTSLIHVADQARTLDLVSAAFADDPFTRWLFPDDADFARQFPGFISAVTKGAYAAQTAWQLDDFAAVALFRNPNAESDPETIGGTLHASVPEEHRTDLFSALEQLEDAHPKQPHWYLPVLAVDPARRGQGLGGELLTACLARIDVSGLPVFLHSYSVRTVPFFERHGFVVTGRIKVGTVPELTMMLRESRS